jgi:hypothetical protein
MYLENKNGEKGTTKNGLDIQSLVIDNNVITNQNKIANTFISYFLSIVDSINTDINKHIQTGLIQLIIYQTVLEDPTQK